ncbi:MAG: hypothetical protein ABSB14_15840 [Candidatus Sulfotelmatobacter sp.]|jgi:hypothetical protein
MVTATFEQQILEEAAASPVVAIMRLTLEIDRELRKLLAATGNLSQYQGVLPEAIGLLERANGIELPRELKDTLTQFWSLRNHVVHSQVSEHMALRALDYGLRILKMVKSIPRYSYVVVRADIPVYANSACNPPAREDVRGVILETFSPEGKPTGRHIFPSTKTYSAGESVSWEWNRQNEKGWGPSWYQEPDPNDPSTRTIKSAWGESLEFVGRNLEDI